MFELIDKIGGSSVLIGLALYAAVQYFLIAPALSERISEKRYLPGCIAHYQQSKPNAEDVCRRAIRRATGDTQLDWAIYTGTLSLVKMASIRNFQDIVISEAENL